MAMGGLPIWVGLCNVVLKYWKGRLDRSENKSLNKKPVKEISDRDGWMRYTQG
jgi:hypothetical protein